MTLSEATSSGSRHPWETATGGTSSTAFKFQAMSSRLLVVEISGSPRDRTARNQSAVVVVAGIMYSPETAENFVGEGWRSERRNTLGGVVYSLPESAARSALSTIAQTMKTTRATMKSHTIQQMVFLHDHFDLGRTRVEGVGVGCDVSDATF